MNPARLVVVAGPTASGKTDLAVRLAERLGGEVVSADSQQVYRGFNIGTAKPSPAELARAPHHLLSIFDARSERMDAARFAEHADAAIAKLSAGGKLAIVAGGTGLYLRALLHGVMPAPPRDLAFREALRARAQIEGWQPLHAELAEQDPEAAALISPNDRVRIERALELRHTTGRKASELRREHGFLPARYAFIGFRLELPRAELFARIDARAQAMFDGGLVEETQAMIDAGLADAPPMASIGYVQVRAMLRGELTREQAILEAALQTRRYAKRQLTWFKKEPGLRPIAPPDDEAFDLLILEVRRFIESG